jgi:O-antigen ligase
MTNLKDLLINDIFTQISIGIIILCIIILLALLTWKNYKIAIFLALISPLISAIFVSISGYQPQASIGSYIRVFLIFFVGTIGYFQYYKRRQLSEHKLPIEIKLLALYLFIAIGSTAYSLDPTITIIRSSTFFMLFGFLLGLYSWINTVSDFDATMNTIYYGIITIIILNLVVFIVNNDLVWYKGGTRFCGLWGQPNVFGMFAMVSYPVLFWKWQSKTYNQYLHPFIFTFILVLFHLITGSRGSILASVIGFIMWLIIQRAKIKLAFLLLSLCLVTFFFIYDIEEIRVFKRQTTSGSSVLTLNKREEFWSAMKILIIEKPITGYGYGIGGKIWQDPRFYKEGHKLWSGSARTSLHSGYLSAIINTGMLSFMIWIYILFQPVLKLKKYISNKIRAPIIFVMVSCFILNITESLIGGGSGPAAMMFWMMWIMAVRFNNDEGMSIQSC